MSKKVRTLLIVDDEENVRNSLEGYLSEKDYMIVLASDGDEALQLFQSTKIDLVLSDIRMPRMNGLKLLKAVKNIKHSMPVILMTGYEMSKEELSMLPCRAEAYVSKPFNMENMLTLIENLLK